MGYSSPFSGGAKCTYDIVYLVRQARSQTHKCASKASLSNANLKNIVAIGKFGISADRQTKTTELYAMGLSLL